MQVESKNNSDDHYLIYHEKQLKCVCEICTCGKHSCPRSRIKGNFETSYAQEFKQPPKVQAPYPYRQYKYEQRHYSPESLKTNYQENFHDTPVQQAPKQQTPNTPNRFQKVGSKIILYHVPFTGTSSYKDQFKGFEIKPVRQNPEQAPMAKGEVLDYTYNRAPVVKFQGVSSYKTSFSPPPPPEKTMVHSLAPMSKPVQIPFYGDSSYKNDFPAYRIEPRKQENLQANKVKVPRVKFEGRSSYKDQFTGYTIQAPPEATKSQILAKKPCVVQNMHVPPVNYVNERNHIYYDPESKTFV